MGEKLVLYQNSTVGKNHGTAPVLGEGVVMYPNTAVIGRCTIGDRTVIAQGVGVVNRDNPRRRHGVLGRRGRTRLPARQARHPGRLLPLTRY